ncbi:hypothetical protein GY45DRAFT_1332259 [Cubamyces sp. BRFM 1775]|nr:hypothetical protein GY45DRAFT_1332259 [Cubamyces sp. BRFM 1775]
MYSMVPLDIPQAGLSHLTRAEVLRLLFATSTRRTSIRSRLVRVHNQNAVHRVMPALMGPAYTADEKSISAVLPMHEHRSWDRWLLLQLERLDRAASLRPCNSTDVVNGVRSID